MGLIGLMKLADAALMKPVISSLKNVPSSQCEFAVPPPQRPGGGVKPSIGTVSSLPPNLVLPDGQVAEEPGIRGIRVGQQARAIEEAAAKPEHVSHLVHDDFVEQVILLQEREVGGVEEHQAEDREPAGRADEAGPRGPQHRCPDRRSAGAAR